MNFTQRLRLDKSGLLVIDIQERLLSAMHEKERMAQNAIRLVKGASILGLPVWVTEQYRPGLGGTIHDIASAIPCFDPIEKMAFSAIQADGLIAELHSRKVENVILCGIECHVCVCMTCLDLIERGFKPFIVSDAVSSRTFENFQIGIERMRHAGATIVSAEMVLFELLERADSPAFKHILSLLK